MLSLSFIYTSLLALSTVYSSSVPRGGRNFACSDALIPVSVKTEVPSINLAPPKGQSELTGLFVDLFSVNSSIASTAVSGTRQLNAEYKIYSELCVPKNWKSGGTLMLAIHGVSYDHSYWNFDSPDSKYNFVNSMAKIGVAVLSYDRLGTGRSSKPDGSREVLAETQVEIAHQIAQKVRGGLTKLKFGKLVGVGHSFGSIQVSGVASKFPKDFDHLVLTGLTLFGDFVPLAFSGFSPVVAALGYPQKFGRLPFDYIAQANQFTHEYAFFKLGGFEERISRLSQAKLSTATLGEVLTLRNPLNTPASNFTGQVFSVIGQEDILFCPGFCAQTAVGTNQTLVENLSTFFPAAAKFESLSPKRTGHAVTLHTSVDETIPAIQKFVQQL